MNFKQIIYKLHSLRLCAALADDSFPNRETLIQIVTFVLSDAEEQCLIDLGINLTHQSIIKNNFIMEKDTYDRCEISFYFLKFFLYIKKRIYFFSDPKIA